MDFQRLDHQQRLVLGVMGMEVRWSVVIVVHSDDDAEERADARHECSVLRSGASILKLSGQEEIRHATM